MHALWATFTYKRGSQQARRRFHTFSTVVWLAWLVPYIIGMLVGIPAIHLQAVCAIGTSVIGGMLVATLVAPLFVPFFFRWIMRASEKLMGTGKKEE